MGGAPSENGGLEGPTGGLDSLLVAGPGGRGRSSFRARGPVGGALPVEGVASEMDAVRFGMEPNDGAAGAIGGGDTSLVDGGGS